MKHMTLCYPIFDGRVLLAMKKRDFGKGKWNGPGGKLQPGETAKVACLRETEEETGARVVDLKYVGTIESVFEAQADWNNICDVFVGSCRAEEAHETEEMLPRWFAFDEVPYEQMWEDDRHWLPEVLKGGSVSKRFFYDAAGRLARIEELDLPSTPHIT